ncbi:MAG: L-serine ammonia-lyase, iron-sulfur-dependent subunit beta [Clostridiaceae bacterium]|nr:L-serine ammonia-lyase, iron-sulfur-dependent subunit beta [Eubacteriales bacterium]
MQKFSVLEIIGPRMIGPSSSHTAGAARLAHVAFKLAGGDVKSAELTLYGSFAETGRGHGTDKALVAGILGMAPDDENLRISFELAKERGVDVRVVFSDEPVEQPNTARIKTVNSKGEVSELVGVSVGGGNILVTELNGMKLKFTGEYPTLVLRHQDVPGVINSVTGILAKEQINVAFMRVFRHAKRKDAYMVIETDTPVPQRTIELINDWCPEITEVKTL